ncbi:MAG: Stp1/IreP family PP2C-type Ser/Thr phosphatase [Lachnospiraceae bacterium]|nr:Stp1/IreP family PP2C-type Ser/Thr phosphatase [Lachnospiraceae bacterium]
MKSAALTDIGRQRALNQDFIFRSDEAIGLLPSLYIVADGMGGHKAGDYASRFCVEDFIKEARTGKFKTLLGGLESIINIVNEHVYNKSVTVPEYKGMGTTLVAAVVDENTVTVSNVGDSRMYLFSENEGLKQITVDHSLVENMIRVGKLERKEAAHHPKKNVITRAIGVDSSVEPDFYEIDLEKGDIILLCSDGLSNMVDDDRITDCLKETKDLDEKARELVDYANERGGKDNISVVLIEI